MIVIEESGLVMTGIALPVKSYCLDDADRAMHDYVRQFPWLKIKRLLGIRYIRHTFKGYGYTDTLGYGAMPCWSWEIEDDYWEWYWRKRK